MWGAVIPGGQLRVALADTGGASQALGGPYTGRGVWPQQLVVMPILCGGEGPPQGLLWTRVRGQVGLL